MFEPNFMTVKEAMESEKAERDNRKPEDMCQYGVSFLNDALTGILPDELVVVGADTGVGKTQFVTDLAFQNAVIGMNVYLFSLEGSKNEVMSQIRYRYLCQEYFKAPDGRRWDYKTFLMGGIDTTKYDKIVDEKILRATNLHIYDNSFRLDLDALEKQLGRITDADLIIHDHLHYLSLDDSKSEYAQISNIVSTIKDITKMKKIPIVSVSHLRKKDRFRKLPDNEDFHGSSNIAKEADTCIMITRSDDYDDPKKSKTIFRVTKSRTGGERRYMGMMTYDLSNRKYENDYLICVTGKNGEPCTLPDDKYPVWAKQSHKTNSEATSVSSPPSYQKTTVDTKDEDEASEIKDTVPEVAATTPDEKVNTGPVYPSPKYTPPTYIPPKPGEGFNSPKNPPKSTEKADNYIRPESHDNDELNQLMDSLNNPQDKKRIQAKEDFLAQQYANKR
ncbi:hypothetical protein BVY03_05830 [bacterium K02(2017)]|nr:hypothetical protein BVY03_05830 [bacterium K02(2017)]